MGLLGRFPTILGFTSKSQGVFFCFFLGGANIEALKPLNFLAPFGGAWSKVKSSFLGGLSWVVATNARDFAFFFRGKKHHDIRKNWMFG